MIWCLVRNACPFVQVSSELVVQKSSCCSAASGLITGQSSNPNKLVCIDGTISALPIHGADGYCLSFPIISQLWSINRDLNILVHIDSHSPALIQNCRLSPCGCLSTQVLSRKFIGGATTGPLTNSETEIIFSVGRMGIPCCQTYTRYPIMFYFMAEEIILVPSLSWKAFFVQVASFFCWRPLKRTAQIVGIAKVFTLTNILIQVSARFDGVTAARDVTWSQFVTQGTNRLDFSFIDWVGSRHHMLC